MSKPKQARRLDDHEAQAIARNIRVSPRKLNLVAGLIRNRPASEAVAALTFSKRRIAHQVRKTLESAIANAENNHQLDVDRLYVSRAEVGRAVVMRRFHARGRGRSARIEKWFSHLTIVVAERAQETGLFDDAETASGQAARAEGTAGAFGATAVELTGEDVSQLSRNIDESASNTAAAGEDVSPIPGAAGENTAPIAAIIGESGAGADVAGAAGEDTSRPASEDWAPPSESAGNTGEIVAPTSESSGRDAAPPEGPAGENAASQTAGEQETAAVAQESSTPQTGGGQGAA